MATFGTTLARDRRRMGFTVSQVAWRLGIGPGTYREIEAGERAPDFETWDRICKLYGWPQAFVGAPGS
jgi:transcriptional regulator with XRE-family HTH domain